MIKIERIYERLRKDVVAVHRRLVTPFFFVRLKSKTYTRYENKTRIFGGGYTPFIILPEKMAYTIKGWKSSKEIEASIKLKKR